MIAAPQPRKWWVCAGLLACIGATLLAPRPARGVQAPTVGKAVIPPGHEELFAAMLGRGAALPDGCTFAAGEIERTVVRGVYRCPGGEVGLELRHTSGAPAEAVRTEKLAIVTVRGAPSATLVAAVAEIIREREGAFEWLKPKTMIPTREPGCLSLAPLPRTLEPYVPRCYPLVAAVLVGLAQITIIVLGLACGLLRLSRTPASPDGS